MLPQSRSKRKYTIKSVYMLVGICSAKLYTIVLIKYNNKVCSVVINNYLFLCNRKKNNCLFSTGRMGDMQNIS